MLGQVDGQFAFGIGADLIEPFAPVSAGLAARGLQGVATLLVAGILGDVGERIDRVGRTRWGGG